MNIELLKSQIKLENDRVLLIPFDTLKNQELRNIIFKDEIWKFMGIFIRTSDLTTTGLIYFRSFGDMNLGIEYQV